MSKTEMDTKSLIAAIRNIREWPESDPFKQEALEDYTRELAGIIGEEAAEAVASGKE
jgi:hypothetical protein